MEGGDQLALSATHQYRKVMKPLLERKRRARINSCLEELKELMEATGGGGEGMQRLEKADVLEVTVRHLRGLKARGRLAAGTDIASTTTFRTGFSACAREVSSFLSAPDSGVEQRQAIHIALGVAEGMRRLQEPAGGLEDLENLRPASPPRLPAPAPPAPASPPAPADPHAPLDLSIK
jgi:hairy-and-enhancer-of-split protein